MRYAAVVAGSPEEDTEFISRLDLSGCYVVAVDHGYDICLGAGIRPDLFVGDMDSLAGDVGNDIEAERLPPKKDFSDTFYALTRIEDRFDRVFVFNANGGRPDHAFFNMFLPLEFSCKTLLVSKWGTVEGLKPGVECICEMKRGEEFSLLPVQQCRGVDVKGCVYPLEGATLKQDTLSLSNVSLGDTRISFIDGKMLLFRTGIPSELESGK